MKATPNNQYVYIVSSSFIYYTRELLTILLLNQKTISCNSGHAASAARTNPRIVRLSTLLELRDTEVLCSLPFCGICFQTLTFVSSPVVSLISCIPFDYNNTSRNIDFFIIVFDTFYGADSVLHTNLQWAHSSHNCWQNFTVNADSKSLASRLVAKSNFFKNCMCYILRKIDYQNDIWHILSVQVR